MATFKGSTMKTFVCLALFTIAFADKTLYYNIGGPAIGKFCADPSNLIIQKNSKAYVQSNQVGALGALASHRTTPGGKFEYLFPVGPGTYKVVLGWAEVIFGANDMRVFDIWINDKKTLVAWDVHKGANGKNKVIWRAVTAKVTGKDLKVSFVKGPKQNPFVSVIEITATNGKDLGTCKKGGGPAPAPEGPKTPPQAPTGGGNSCSVSKPVDKGMTGGFDHQAHSVAGDAYTKVDFQGDGKVVVFLDGTRSHSHFFNPKSKESGKIVSYKWEANGKVIGTTATLNAVFPVGKTIVKLTVKDNLGDIACDTATVTGLSSFTAGAYCYFYPGLTQLSKTLNVNPKPSYGVKVAAINFPNLASFPFPGKNGNTWTMRCLSDVKVGGIPAGALGVRRNGRGALYVNGKTVMAEASGGGSGLVKINSGFSGTLQVNAVYHKQGPGAQFELSLNGKPVGKGAYSFSQGSVIPIVTGISPGVAAPGGGGQMQIFGSGFVNNPNVYVGKFLASGLQVTSTNQLIVTVPSQAQAGGAIVQVYVGNKAGQSVSKILKYGGGASIGTIKWKQTFLQKANGQKAVLPLLASVAVGPDFNYYFGSQDGFVFKVSAGKDLKILSQCKSFSMGQARSVLGIAFNPWKKAAQPYITTSTIFRKSSKVNTPLKNKVDGWANGNVETLYPGCSCFCSKKIVVSGLPVSHHDHAVNKIQFLNNGDMLISVAGTTNGGHNTPNNLLGGLEESPLSGAILLAKTSKGDNIAGNIKYTQYTNPNKANKMGGGDISIFATGLRNCFGLTLTTTNKVYATDNGANKGFGLKSTGCNSQVPFTGNIPDELNFITKGGHYGHPNRNRGRFDKKQCVWGSGFGAVTTFQSSTVGIVEYRSNAFLGTLKGDLIATQYTTQNAAFQGASFRIQLQPDGKVKNKLVMAKFSGVAVDNGLHGELVMPRVGKNQVAVLQPVYTPPNKPFVVSVTPKIGQGSQQILVGGNNFKPGLKAFVGGKPCTKVVQVYGNSFKCTTPPGSGLVGVEVINPDGAKSPTFGGDYKYL